MSIRRKVLRGQSGFTFGVLPVGSVFRVAGDDAEYTKLPASALGSGGAINWSGAVVRHFADGARVRRCGSMALEWDMPDGAGSC